MYRRREGEVKTRPAGYGFITFESQAVADKALKQLQGVELDGRTIKIAYAKPDVPREERPRRQRKPKAAKKETGGEGEEGTTGPAGEEMEPIQGTAETDAGKQEKKKKAAKKPRVRDGPPLSERALLPATVYVANIPFSTTADQLSHWVKENGLSAVKATIAERPGREGQMRSLGFGFVEFKSEADKERALEELKGKQLDGRKVLVKPAREPYKPPAADAEAEE